MSGPEVVERFLRYVKIDTQSQTEVEDRYPSTEKQKDLGRLLVDELKDMEIEDLIDIKGINYKDAVNVYNSFHR